jgi:hypothetical protein
VYAIGAPGAKLDSTDEPKKYRCVADGSVSARQSFSGVVAMTIS